MSDFHRWRVEQIAHVSDLMSELAELLAVRQAREEAMIVEAMVTGRSVWQYADEAEEARIAELRATLDAYRRVNLWWRALPSIPDTPE